MVVVEGARLHLAIADSSYFLQSARQVPLASVTHGIELQADGQSERVRAQAGLKARRQTQRTRLQKSSSVQIGRVAYYSRPREARRTCHVMTLRRKAPTFAVSGKSLNRPARAGRSLAGLVGEQYLFEALGRTGEKRQAQLVRAEDAEVLEEGFGGRDFVPGSKEMNERQNLV